MDHLGHDGFETPAEALGFIFSGNAIFTVTSMATGKHYTFKVAVPRGAGDLAPFMCSVLNGPDNWANYEYLGHIKAGDEFLSLRGGLKGRPHYPSFKALQWTLRYLMAQLSKGEGVDKVRVQHEGKCGRCGRKLTRPESIASGIGPECATKTVAL